MKNSKFVKALLVASVLVSSASIAQAAEGETIFKARLLGSFPNKSKLTFNGKAFNTTPAVDGKASACAGGTAAATADSEACTSAGGIFTAEVQATQAITGLFVKHANSLANAARDDSGTLTSIANQSQKLTKNGFGVDLSGAYFFTKEFASELSVGLIYSKYTASDGMKLIGVTADSKKVWTVPVTLTAQYHPMSGSQVSPYVGAGIAYIYNNSPKGTTGTLHDGVATATAPRGAALGTISFAVPKGFAGVLQAGVDVSATDGIGFNLDIKKYFMKNKKATTTFYTDATGGANFVSATTATAIQSTAKMDREFSPLVVSAGVSFKF